MKLALKPKEPTWWVWLLTVALLVAGLAGWTSSFLAAIAVLRRSLEIELRSGPQKLNDISVTAERMLRECEARTASLVQKQAQAGADGALCS
jgi:hypothetical protein